MKETIIKLLKEKPGLKGREIAKKIGVDKKEVNSFLPKYPNEFIQDGDFCWFLVNSKQIKIEFDKKWVDRNIFESSLQKAGSPLDFDCTSVVFVIPEGCKILLDAAARLLALCNQLILLNRSVKVDFSDCLSTFHYFNRIGFLNHLDENIEVSPERPKVSASETYKGNSNAVVEFGAVDPSQTNKALINQLSDAFVQQSHSRYEAAVFTVFGELIGNIKEHSKSAISGFAALQKYEGKGRLKKHIQTVISDSGLGIANTLRPSLKEHHPHLYKLHKVANIESDIELVIATMSKGEISRLGKGRGMGFKSSREQAMKFDAQLSVRQERFCLDFIYKDGELMEVKKELNLPKILGTHICFDFFVD